MLAERPQFRKAVVETQIRFKFRLKSLRYLGSRRHVHTHPAKRFGLSHQGFGHLLIWPLNQGPERAAHELSRAVRPPNAADWPGAAPHDDLEVFVLDCGIEVSCEDGFAGFVYKMDSAEPKLKHNVVVIFYHVLHCKENGIQNVLDHVLAHLARMGDRHGVCVDHPKALLEYRALRLRRRYLLLAVISSC